MTRQEAIEALTSKDVSNSDVMLKALEMAINALKQEPKTGKWICEMYDSEMAIMKAGKIMYQWGSITFKCPFCHFGISFPTEFPSNEKGYNFCPNCGARMER